METINNEDKIQELVLKYCSNRSSTRQQETWCGATGFMHKMLDEAIKYGMKCGDMHALDYTLIHFGNEDALKKEIEKLRHELKAEERSHTYWREEYYKLLDKVGSK